MVVPHPVRLREAAGLVGGAVEFHEVVVAAVDHSRAQVRHWEIAHRSGYDHYEGVDQQNEFRHRDRNRHPGSHQSH